MIATHATSLRSARVTFTGRLASFTRQKAERLVRDCGGQVLPNVSRRLSLLVVGMDGWPLSPDGSVNHKLRQAEEINRSGRRIRIVSELEFLELIGCRERSASVYKTHSADEIARLLGIELQTLRRWEALGLIRAADGLYDFQDLVSLRTVVGLVSRGVRPDVISRSLHDLSTLLPDTQRPLAQLRIVKESSRSLLAELGEHLISTDGQLLLRFDADSAPHDAAIRIARPWAETWFARGRQFEEQELLEEAADAYERALAAAPDWAEAHFNLGNVRRALQQAEHAAASFRAATELDPAFADAWYNLADMQQEDGHFAEAIASLRAVIRLNPSHADAHFNLASCLESAGDCEEAGKYWRRYLALDDHSEWADHARQRLHELQRHAAARP